MKSILVIGGAGYIGSHTVVDLIEAGYRPVIVDNYSNSSQTTIKRLDKLTGQSVTNYKLDYKDTVGLEKIITKEKVDGIIHFAAFKAVGESVEKPLMYYENNVSGFIGLLQLVQKFKIKHFVLSSSAAVYGNPPEDTVDEETICRPTSPYGWSKFMDEVILRDYVNVTKNMNGIALRYFNVIGAHKSAIIGELPKGRPQNVLPLIINAATGDIDPIVVYGTDYPTPDGSALRDYIDVNDLARAHVAALNKSFEQKLGFKVYNVGTGKPTSVLDLISQFEKSTGVKVPYTLGDRRAGDPVAFYASANKIKNELSWEPKNPTDKAISSAWQWKQVSDKPLDK